MTLITDLFTRLGISRDDAKWLWAQVVTLAGAITAGVIDLSSLGTYLGVTLSPAHLHQIIAVCMAIGWFAGAMRTSPLHNNQVVADINRKMNGSH